MHVYMYVSESKRIEKTKRTNKVKNKIEVPETDEGDGDPLTKYKTDNNNNNNNNNITPLLEMT